MRGKRGFLYYDRVTDRNIPAYAGKTARAQPWHAGTWEHPRVCGENLQHNVYPGAVAGTSPRMRGKHLLNFGINIALRNIPAYAGKT